LKAIAASTSHKQLTTAEAVKIALKDHRDVVAGEIEDHLEISLKKIAGDVLSKSTYGRDESQAELFQEYRFSKRIGIPADNIDGSRTTYKYTTDATRPEIEKFIARFSGPRKIPVKVAEIIRAKDELMEFFENEETTLGEAWATKVRSASS
jgi:hypothetical protein